MVSSGSACTARYAARRSRFGGLLGNTAWWPSAGFRTQSRSMWMASRPQRPPQVGGCHRLAPVLALFFNAEAMQNIAAVLAKRPN
jgi:hypothetical protein